MEKESRYTSESGVKAVLSSAESESTEESTEQEQSNLLSHLS